jgi:hypothetical protein
VLQFVFYRQLSIFLSELLVFGIRSSRNRLSFGGGNCFVSIDINFIQVWIVLEYDWWLRVRLRVGVTASVVAGLSCSKDVYIYHGVPNNSVRNLILKKT